MERIDLDNVPHSGASSLGLCRPQMPLGFKYPQRSDTFKDCASRHRLLGRLVESSAVVLRHVSKRQLAVVGRTKVSSADSARVPAEIVKIRQHPDPILGRSGRGCRRSQQGRRQRAGDGANGFAETRRSVGRNMRSRRSSACPCETGRWWSIVEHQATPQNKHELAHAT